MSDHADLLAELEAATEGSRELSDKCLLAVGWTMGNQVVGFPDDGKSQLVWWVPGGGLGYDQPRQPDPARSLDDAIKWMAPEGWGFMVRYHATAKGMLACASCLAPTDSEASDSLYDQWAKTPALALCIACLKARASDG